MDTHFQFQGLSFVWNAQKAKTNVINHDGISFEQAAEAFFDPFMRLVDASSARRFNRLRHARHFVICCAYGDRRRNNSHYFSKNRYFKGA